MTKPRVSVIVPVFDGRGTVGRALESDFAQTLPAEEVEVIVVDDGSTDGTSELLDELAHTTKGWTSSTNPAPEGRGPRPRRAHVRLDRCPPAVHVTAGVPVPGRLRHS